MELGGDPDPLRDASLKRVRAWAAEVVDLVDQDRTLHGMPGDYARRASIPASLAAAFALYRSLLAMVDAGQTAGVGAAMRTLYEHWVTTVIICQGEKKDWAKLMADYNVRQRKLAEGYHMKAPVPIETDPHNMPKQTWEVASRAKRADKIRGVNEAYGLYETVYAVESFGSTHAGLGVIGQHFTVDETGLVAIDHEPIPEQTTKARLAIATLFLAHTAIEVLTAGGCRSDAEAIDRLSKRYHPPGWDIGRAQGRR